MWFFSGSQTFWVVVSLLWGRHCAKLPQDVFASSEQAANRIVHATRILLCSHRPRKQPHVAHLAAPYRMSALVLAQRHHRCLTRAPPNVSRRSCCSTNGLTCFATSRTGEMFGEVALCKWAGGNATELHYHQVASDGLERQRRLHATKTGPCTPGRQRREGADSAC